MIAEAVIQTADIKARTLDPQTHLVVIIICTVILALISIHILRKNRKIYM